MFLFINKEQDCSGIRTPQDEGTQSAFFFAVLTMSLYLDAISTVLSVWDYLPPR